MAQPDGLFISPARRLQKIFWIIIEECKSLVELLEIPNQVRFLLGFLLGFYFLSDSFHVCVQSNNMFYMSKYVLDKSFPLEFVLSMRILQVITTS